MAKKKKHKKSKSKHNKVVKNTTINKTSNMKPNNTQQEDVISNQFATGSITSKINEDKEYKEDNVVRDVKFSLALMGIIIGSFVLLYFLLQNKTISDQIYGIIKINF